MSSRGRFSIDPRVLGCRHAGVAYPSRRRRLQLKDSGPAIDLGYLGRGGDSDQSDLFGRRQRSSHEERRAYALLPYHQSRGKLPLVRIKYAHRP